jgi:hypothetical protein
MMGNQQPGGRPDRANGSPWAKRHKGDGKGLPVCSASLVGLFLVLALCVKTLGTRQEVSPAQTDAG